MRRHVTIPGLPSPDIYELEYQYWPWGQMISKVEEWVVQHAPPGALIVDYMCGFGYLLNRIAKRRSDLLLHGHSFDEEWINYGKKRYPNIYLEYSDSLKYRPPDMVDIAIVSGGIHHLEFSEQPRFFSNIRNQIRNDGYFIVAEEVIAQHSGMNERRSAVLKLGGKLLSFVIEHHAPDQALEAAVDLLKRDLFCSGEYKICMGDLKKLIEVNFSIGICEAIWPLPEENYGDYFMVCLPKQREGI